MAFRNRMNTLLGLLRGYRPPRFLFLMLGACASALILAFWIVLLQPLQVIRECETYRLRFGTQPEYKLSATNFHCEFKAEDIQGGKARPRAQESI